MTMTDLDVWAAPGPGFWGADTGHFPTPCTAFFAAVFPGPATRGWNRGMAAYGIPISVTFEMVNGISYCAVALTGADTWEELESNAIETYETARWRADYARWQRELGPAFRARNLELQHVDLGRLDDEALAAHIDDVTRHLADGVDLHMELVGPSLPVGEFLARASASGWTADDAAALLGGGSPATAGTLAPLRRIAAAIEGAGAAPPITLDDVRAAGPEASAALDAYLDEFGWRITTAFDLEGRCLVELPTVVAASIRAAASREPSVAPERSAELPAALKEFLDDARALHGCEDDNAAITWVWPLGLVRRALLEAGRRLELDGRVERRAHILETEPHEAVSLVRGDEGPDAETLAERAAHRRALTEKREWPPAFGEPAPMDLDALPPVARRATVAMLALFGSWGTRDLEALHGTGIGAVTYRGRACVSDDPADAIERVRPGDILVTPFTTPAYNAVLLDVGGLVVEEGGPLIHAAVLARELGLPAVIGARGARSLITDGDEIEIDPVAGAVRILTRHDRTPLA